MSFVGQVVTRDTALGLLEIGVVDPEQPGVAEGVSALLTRSIHDARASAGGHLPDWLVADIKQNYTSADKVRTLWAATGHRFAARLNGEWVATIHIARDPDTIFTVDRTIINARAQDYPGFKPEGYHHVVNISTRHELRRARLAWALVDAICTDFRALFAGEGLWVRADPPWHPGLSGLGFVHDPRGDIFLPKEVERTSDLPHAAFNQRYACACEPQTLEHAQRMREMKLQYVSMSRPFAREPALLVHGHASREPSTIEEAQAFLTTAPGPVRIGARQATLSTLRLNRVLAVSDRTMTVQGGTTWETVLAALPAGAAPPVVTAWLGATVGGTLSTGGFGKGSYVHGWQVDHVHSLTVITGDGRRVFCSQREAAWLFDAALGGLGRFGLIAEATITLLPMLPCVTVTRHAGLQLEHEGAYHVAAFFDAAAWTTVVARVSESGIPRAEYWHGSRPQPDGASHYDYFVDGAHLDACLAACVPRKGESLQVVPVREVRPHVSLLQNAAPVGELAYAVLLTCPKPREAPVVAGAQPSLAGTWPATAFAPPERVRRLADPRGILV